MSAIALSMEWQIGGGASEPTLTRLTTAFERAGAEVANVGKHILPRLIPVLEGATAKQLDAEGGGPAGPFAPLSAKYAAWKERNFPGQPILRRTGAMAAALTESGAPGARRDVSGDSLTFGTSGVPYASFHQTGTRRMPTRAPFDFGGDLDEQLRKVAMAGIRAALREASAGLLDFEGDTFTDDDGQTYAVQSGKRGGRFAVIGGSKVYLKRDKAGRVVKRKLGARP